MVRLLRGKKGKSMKAEQVELEETFSGGGSLAWIPSLPLCVFRDLEASETVTSMQHDGLV